MKSMLLVFITLLLMVNPTSALPHCTMDNTIQREAVPLSNNHHNSHSNTLSNSSTMATMHHADNSHSNPASSSKAVSDNHEPCSIQVCECEHCSFYSALSSLKLATNTLKYKASNETCNRYHSQLPYPLDKPPKITFA